MATHITLDQVVQLITKQLGRKRDAANPVRGDGVLQDLGLSSLDITEVFMALEELADCELDPAGAADIETVMDLADAVNRMVDAHSPTPV